MSDNDTDIRNARLLERQRRNNPWSEPAVTERRATDAEILDAARTKRIKSDYDLLINAGPRKRCWPEYTC